MWNTLEEIDMFRTPECLDTISIGLLVEGKLPGKEKQRAEKHLLSCLCCLKQLNEKHRAATASALAEFIRLAIEVK
jgi:hypothetical protein